MRSRSARKRASRSSTWTTTGNPRAAYPNDTVIADEIGKRPDGRLDLPTHEVYVEIDDLAVASASPWPMPGPARHRQVVFVPPYADPLDQATDPRAWWDKHKPLRLQTGAVGLWENQEVSFSGFRLIRLRDNVIERIDFVSRIRLDERLVSIARGGDGALPRVRTDSCHAVTGSTPPAAGTPTTLVAQGGRVSTSIVHPTADGSLVELWQTTSGEGGGVLVGPPQTHAVGRPCGYLDSGGSQVVVFRTADDEIGSTYWTGEGAAGHDRLSRSCSGPRAVGDPSGYLNGAMTHVVYRSEGGHLELLWWTDDAVTHTRISGYCDEPTAAGDPFGYVGAGVERRLVPRGWTGTFTRSTGRWADRTRQPVGRERWAGNGRRAGRHPPATPQCAQRLVSRGRRIASPDLVGGRRARPVGRPVRRCRSAGCGVRRGPLVLPIGRHPSRCLRPGRRITARDRLVSGGPQTWTDLTRVALAPPARRDRPSGFCVPGPPRDGLSTRLPMVGSTRSRWGEGGASRAPSVTRELGNVNPSWPTRRTHLVVGLSTGDGSMAQNPPLGEPSWVLDPPATLTRAPGSMMTTMSTDPSSAAGSSAGWSARRRSRRSQERCHRSNRTQRSAWVMPFCASSPKFVEGGSGAEVQNLVSPLNSNSAT